LRIAVWTGDARDTRPKTDFRPASPDFRKATGVANLLACAPGAPFNLCPSSSFGEAVSFHHLVQVLISVDFPEQPAKKPVTDIRFFRVVGLAFGTLHHLVSSGTSVVAMFLAYFVPRWLKVLLLPH
jgi:hypothetical protein